MKERIILHIDFDSYFASCEQQFNPSLRGKPVGVVATNGRTCIIAASREAKKMGVKSPSRTWEVKNICSNLITVPGQFDRYWEITQKFLSICKDYTPYVELFSLDEVFMDITHSEHLFGGRHQIIETIKQRIAKEIGEYITVSVGLSYNKLLAKLGSGMNKPNGFKEIESQDILDVYSQIKLTDLCGIGFRVEKRLQNIGINSPMDLRRTSLARLIKEFKTAEGNFLFSLGQAYDDREVIPYWIPSETKSVGRNYCIPKNCYDQRAILQHVQELCEEVGIKLRRIGKKSRTVGLYLGGAHNWHGRKTVHNHIDSGKDLFALCQELYDEWGLAQLTREEGMVRQISVWTGNLEDSANLTLSLFDQEKKNYGKVQNAIDSINEKHGDHTLLKASLLYGPNLKTVPNGYMADRFERQKLVNSF